MSVTDVIRSSVKAPEFDKKHQKKTRGYIGWNVVNIITKMKTIVQKPWMIRKASFIKIWMRNSKAWTLSQVFNTLFLYSCLPTFCCTAQIAFLNSLFVVCPNLHHHWCISANSFRNVRCSRLRSSILLLWSSRGISVHAFEFSWAENLSAQHMGWLVGCKIEAGVNAGAREQMEVSLRCHNSPRRYWVTRCGWRHAPEARGSLCENLKKIRVGFWTPNEKDQFWSSQARGEFAPYGGGRSSWGPNE